MLRVVRPLATQEARSFFFSALFRKGVLWLTPPNIIRGGDRGNDRFLPVSFIWGLLRRRNEILSRSGL